METAMIPNPQTNCRSAPRALVCARTLVMTEGKPATEHMVYDLSTGGVRLCGLPRAQVGDELKVGLQLPHARVRARGYLSRAGSNAEQPDFTIQFFPLSARAEDAIHDAVIEALSRPDRRSLLLMQSRWNPCWSGWKWLNPVSPICATATTPLEAVQWLEERPFDIGIFGSGALGTHDSEWIEMYQEVSWRSLDDEGRLYRL